MADSFNLKRFVDAQEGDYSRAIEELKAGRKRTHWMWYVFPQIIGLGVTSTSKFYSISSRQEAEAYLEHAILGARLRECTQFVLQNQRRIEEILGGDSVKFRSCMTLFEATAIDPKVFQDALLKFFDGNRDPSTLRILEDQRKRT